MLEKGKVFEPAVVEEPEINWKLVTLTNGKRYYTPEHGFNRWMGVQLNNGRLYKIEDFYIKPDIKLSPITVYINLQQIVEVIDAIV